MDIYSALANLSCGVVCFIVAFVLCFNKNAANLLAGYNTLSAKDKEKYDAPKLCRFIGILSFCWAGLMMITGMFIALAIAKWFMLIGSWTIFAISLVISIVYRSRSNRFMT